MQRLLCSWGEGWVFHQCQTDRQWFSCSESLYNKLLLLYNHYCIIIYIIKHIINSICIIILVQLCPPHLSSHTCIFMSYCTWTPPCGEWQPGLAVLSWGFVHLLLRVMGSIHLTLMMAKSLLGNLRGFPSDHGQRYWWTVRAGGLLQSTDLQWFTNSTLL